MNPFEVLGLQRGATLAEVKTAWRKKAHQHHPDKGGDPQQFAVCKNAYELIDTEEKLARYNGGGVDLRAAMISEELFRDMMMNNMRAQRSYTFGRTTSATTAGDPVFRVILEDDPLGIYDDLFGK